MGRRLLLLLSQNPLDPAGGAARNLDSMCRLLARGGYEIEAIGTSATEFADPSAAAGTVQMLRSAGLNVIVERQDGAPVIRFSRENIRYTLLDTAGWCLDRPHAVHGPRFDRLYRGILERFSPEIVLTFGAMPIERQRHDEARRRGSAVVLSVQQHSYYDRRAFETADAIQTCSEFLRQCYLTRIGVDSVALVGPLVPQDIVAQSHEPVFVTFVNPSYEKGVVFIARLAEELATRRPDIPMLIIESRGTVGQLVAAGDSGGFDLRRHASLMTAPGVPRPRDIYAPTRLLLAPSVWEEPWGRVAAEALFNGIPPLVSDRGGLEEACCGGGSVLPLPKDLTPATRTPPPPEAVEPWLARIIQLCDDENAYQKASMVARTAAEALQPERLLPKYLEFFDHIERRHAI
jgi:glycosyltransferase involved in cell wall biosynthesis